MKRAALIGVVLVALAGLGTGLWSAGEGQQEPPEEPWLDAQSKPLPDASETNEGLVLRVFHGHEHCEWQSVTFLDLAWPLGTIARYPPNPDDYRQYVRDPEGLLNFSVVDVFGRDAQLPPGAMATGYHADGWELWINEPEADRFVYVVHDGRAERWPRARDPIYCY
jgi:hypothetical protein